VCGRKAVARGFCSTCYVRERKSGRLQLLERTRLTPEERRRRNAKTARASYRRGGEVSHLPAMSWGRILAEIEKCEVRCANCHAIRGVNEKHLGRPRIAS
jgi:hypothetical protein